MYCRGLKPILTFHKNKTLVEKQQETLICICAGNAVTSYMKPMLISQSSSDINKDLSVISLNYPYLKIDEQGEIIGWNTCLFQLVLLL